MTLTNPNMTRFLMSLVDSVALVKHAFLEGTTGDLFVQKAPASTVLTLANALARILGKEDSLKYEVIGTRHGEKLYESLLGAEDMSRAENQGKYFKVPLDTRTLDYSKFFENGKNIDETVASYTSHNTEQLSTDEVVDLLMSDVNFKNYIEKL